MNHHPYDDDSFGLDISGPPPRDWLVALFLILLAVVVLALNGVLPAQSVTITNHTDLPFSGWVRCAIDQPVASPAGEWPGASYVVGRSTGLGVRVLDVHCTLAAGARRTLEFGAAEPIDFAPWLPPDPIAHLGGWPHVAGTPLQLITVQPDGASWLGHFRARVGRMLVVDLWIEWQPTQPWSQAEALVTCSNPAVPDTIETVASDLRLDLGDATVHVLGGRPGLLVAAGTRFADGQAQAVSLTLAWMRHVPAATLLDPSAPIRALLSIEAARTRHVTAHATTSLWPDGMPRVAGNARASAHLPSLWAGLHTWDLATCGPAKRSNDAGVQQDQTFVMGDAPGSGVELVSYLNALQWAKRPCNHREADGSPLDPARHVSPRLLFSDGRAHWHLGVSPDQLGKSPMLTDAQTSGGWWGPDVEHWLVNGLAAGARMSGSPMAQAILRAHATVYRLQQTTTPGWSTSSPFASRAVGWEAIAAVHLWREIEDRTLAAAVRAHWRDRWARVIGPAYRGKDVWDPRDRDPRIFADGTGWLPWQQAIAAYGLDLAGRLFEEPEACEVALRGARYVIDLGFRHEGGRWLSNKCVEVGGTNRIDPDNTFWLFGSPMAVELVRRRDPVNERANSIWEQMVADAQNAHQVCWLPPEVR